VAGAFGCDAGGIQGLLALPREHWEAIEADCLAAGWHVRDLNWREIRTMVKHCDRGTALFRVTHGERATWSVTDHLLAMVVDLLGLLVWFKTKDGSKNRNRPKPVARPGDTDSSVKSLSEAEVSAAGALRGEGTYRIGAAMTIAELDALLGRTTELAEN
jgi:hypothetical protein